MEQNLFSAHRDLVKNLATIPEGPSAGLLHAAIGIAGEVQEYLDSETYANTLKEFGDLLFYVMLGWQEIKLATPDGEIPNVIFPTPGKGLRDCQTTLQSESGKLLDFTKKAWAYKQEPDVIKITRSLCIIEAALEQLIELHGFTLDQVRAANIEKLTDRYPEGKFTTHHSIARLDEIPRKPISQLIEEISAGVEIPRASQLVEGLAKMAPDEIFEPFSVLKETYPLLTKIWNDFRAGDPIYQEAVERCCNSNAMIGRDEDELLFTINSLFTFLCKQQNLNKQPAADGA